MTDLITANETWGTIRSKLNFPAGFLEPLDIWPAFSGDWSVSSYANWIAGIDALFASEISGGSVVKTNEGDSSNASLDVFSYAAGNGKLAVLLVGGIHGAETTSQLAAMRWFQQFVKSENSVMRALRRQLRVIWVPTLCAPGFGTTRTNANAVDLNRNFPFFWANYTVPDADRAKGASALSEPEAMIVKAIIDREDVCGVIDTHNKGNSAQTEAIQIAGPSSWILGNREVVFAAMTTFADLYSTTCAEHGLGNVGEPLLINWANFYLRYTRRKRNALTALIECNQNLDGSTATALTAGAAQKYCGAITTILQHWLMEGQSPPKPYAMTWFQTRNNPASTTSISSGGTLVDNTTPAPITFDLVPDISGSHDRRNVVFPCPGTMQVFAEGYLEGAGTAQRVDLAITFNGTAGSGVASVTVPAGTGDRVPFTISYNREVTAGSFNATDILAIGLTFVKNGTITAANPKIIRCRMWVVFTPKFDEAPVPAVPNPPA